MREDRTHLQRRNVLQALGGTAAFVGLAGCLGGNGDGSDNENANDDGSSDDGASDDGGSDNGDEENGGENGDEENGGENGDEENGEEKDNIKPVMEGTVFEADGETKVSEGQLTLFDHLGEQVATHDLAVSAEFRLTGLELGKEYELQITQMAKYPDHQETFVAEPPEGFKEEQESEDGGDGEDSEESGDEEQVVQVRASVLSSSIIDSETNNITLETGVTGAESYAWEGRLQFRTDQRTGEWIHKGERAKNRNAHVIDDNLVRSQRREEAELERVFLYQKANSEDIRDMLAGRRNFTLEEGVVVVIDGTEYTIEEVYDDDSGNTRLRLEGTNSTPRATDVDIVRGVLINPIEEGTNCRRENYAGGYPDWHVHQAVQKGLTPFDDFVFKRRESIEHPGVFNAVRTKVYEVDPPGAPLTFELYADNETGDVMRIDGDFDIAGINRAIFEGELLSTRGKIDFMGHGEDRFIGSNRC